MKLFSTRLKELVRFPNNLLILILIGAFILRVYNLNFNSIFVDEAFYVAIGQKILEGRFDEVLGDISWVGAFPFFYPFFSAVSYEIAGILGARFFAVILGTISIFLIYTFTKALSFFPDRRNNEIAGLIAAAFMATTTIPIASSRLAIYDGLSFVLFLLGLNLYIKAFKQKSSTPYFLSSIIFFLSFLAKYITIIFFPFFLLLILFQKGESFKKALLFFLLPLLVLPAIYIGINFENLQGYISGQVGDNGTTYGDVFNTFWQYSNILYLLALGGIIAIGARKKYMAIALLFISLIPLLLHVLTRNNDSAHQHVFFSIIFILPIIGAFFAQTIKSYGKIAIIGAILILFANFIPTFSQLKDMESFWPNSDNATSFLRERVGGNDVILVEGSDTIMLGLDKKIPTDQIIGPFVFDYNNLENDEAYIKAIEDKYFKFIELENVYFSEELIVRIEQLLTGRYTKIFDDGRIIIYQRNE